MKQRVPFSFKSLALAHIWRQNEQKQSVWLNWEIIRVFQGQIE